MLSSLFCALALNCIGRKLSSQVEEKDQNRNSIRSFSKERAYWPTKKWKIKAPQEAGIRSNKLKELEEYLFQTTGTEEDREGIRTDALLIIKNGYLVYEKYARGYQKNSMHLLWSVAKGFVNAILGIAVKENLISLTDPAFKYHKGLDRWEHRKITIKYLLQHQSGPLLE